MRGWYIKRIKERLHRHFTCNFSRLDNKRFVVGASRHNYQCHKNSAHEALLDAGTRVILCYCVDRWGFGFLHVINRLPNGKFQDNTLGSQYASTDFYYIKEILPDQYHKIDECFEAHRSDWIRNFSRHWLVRLLFIKPVDVI